MNKLSRRTLLSGIAATALLPAPAFAVTETSAKRLVTKAVNEINKIINSGKTENAMIRDFEGVFQRYADVPIIARYTLGADARSMSSAQLNRYAQAFSGYMARKWGGRFREFEGGRIEVQGARKVKSFYEVETKAILRGSSPFEVLFMVSDRGGSERFFNMYIEGVNLLLTERTEVQAMLDARGGNVDRLIRDLPRAG